MTQNKNKDYFTRDTELAIIQYNITDDEIEKNTLYREVIHPAFLKLVENLIHTFKFYYTEESSLDDVQHEVITFLVTKLHRFNPANGAKAYSYFGTIAKRYLIAYTRKSYKKRLDLLSIDALIDDEEDNELLADEERTHIQYDLDEDMLEDPANLSGFIDSFVEYCDDNLYELFGRDEDIQIADAILELFRKRDSLTIFNKKALYLYIREIVDAKTPKITKIANDLGLLFNQHYTFYLEHGHTKF